MGTIIAIMIGWYFIPYRLSKKRYKRRTGKELTYLGSFKPSNWEDM